MTVLEKWACLLATTTRKVNNHSWLWWALWYNF